MKFAVGISIPGVQDRAAAVGVRVASARGNASDEWVDQLKVVVARTLPQILLTRM
jgi:hypothetical protein